MNMLLNKKSLKIIIYTTLIFGIIFIHLPKSISAYCMGNKYEDIVICLNEYDYLEPKKAIEILVNKYDILVQMDLLYQISQAKQNKTILTRNTHKKFIANTNIFGTINTVWEHLSKEQQQKLIKLYEPYLHNSYILESYLALNYNLKDEDKIKLLIDYKNKYTFKDKQKQCDYNNLYYIYKEYYEQGLIKEPYELDCKIQF